MRFWMVLFGQFGLSLAGQSWLPAGLPGDALNLQRVWSTATEDTIYYAGAVRIDTAQWFTNNPVLRYSHGQWDTLGAFNNIIWTFAHFQDTLFVGGDFTSANGMAVEHMACFAHGAWFPCGSFSNRVRSLKVLDGQLYAVGAFIIADGDTCYGIVRRSQGQWMPVGHLRPASFSGLLDVEFFNGNIVVAGAIRVLPGNRLAQFDGTTWTSVGQGVIGSLSGPLCLKSFQGSLYIGGQIRTSEGNPGENIMRWDGYTFHPVGDGIRQVLGSSSTATVTSLTTHQGLLYAGGGYLYVDSMPANGLATWDGSSWCVLPGELMTESSGIWSMSFYQDSLFIATIGDTLEGQFINKAAKSAGILVADTCGLPVGIAGSGSEPPDQLIYPNPCGNYFQVAGHIPVGQLTIIDQLGQELTTIELTGGDDLMVPMPYPHGLYVVRTVSEDGKSVRSTKLLKE